jgi:nitroreductase
MDLTEALRTTGAVREFRDEAVSDVVLHSLLDTARFAPNGGNRQAWRVIVVKDPERRRTLRDLYLRHWYDYLAMGLVGLTPWSPVNDRDEEAAATLEHADGLARAATERRGFAELFDEVPAMLVVLADLRRLATVDRDLGRYTFAGGASVYPFVWNLLLAARAEGLGGVITTMTIREEPAMKALLEVPDEWAVAAVVALGRPVHQPTRLRREPVGDWAWIDRVGGEALESA